MIKRDLISKGRDLVDDVQVLVNNIQSISGLIQNLLPASPNDVLKLDELNCLCALVSSVELFSEKINQQLDIVSFN